MIKTLFFDIGYTLVDESMVWQKRCEEQAATEEAKRLCLSAADIYHEIKKASLARLPQFRTVIEKFHIVNDRRSFNWQKGNRYEEDSRYRRHSFCQQIYR